jgi:hypothetical protein
VANVKIGHAEPVRRRPTGGSAYSWRSWSAREAVYLRAASKGLPSVDGYRHAAIPEPSRNKRHFARPKYRRSRMSDKTHSVNYVSYFSASDSTGSFSAKKIGHIALLLCGLFLDKMMACGARNRPHKNQLHSPTHPNQAKLPIPDGKRALLSPMLTCPSCGRSMWADRCDVHLNKLAVESLRHRRHARHDDRRAPVRATVEGFDAFDRVGG